MRIVYLIAGTYRAAGMERVLANKANWWAAHGHEVHILTTDQRGRPSAFAMDPSINMLDLGINYEENNGASFLSKVLKYPGKQWRHRRRLTKALKTIKADIVVSMFCNDVSFLPKIQDGSRKVLEVHFSRFKRLQYGRKGLWALADRLRSRTDLEHVRAFDRFVVLTEEDKGYWGDLPNIVVIPNSVTTIGNGAFANCTGLSTVNFNAHNCTSAGNSAMNRAFYNCSNISTIILSLPLSFLIQLTLLVVMLFPIAADWNLYLCLIPLHLSTTMFSLTVVEYNSSPFLTLFLPLEIMLSQVVVVWILLPFQVQLTLLVVMLSLVVVDWNQFLCLTPSHQLTTMFFLTAADFNPLLSPTPSRPSVMPLSPVVQGYRPSIL